MTEETSPQSFVKVILSMLESEEWFFHQSDDNQIECDVNCGTGTFSVRICIEDTPNEVGIRIISNYPLKVLQQHRKEVAELITRLNSDFILGHFFLIFSTGEIGYYVAFNPMDAELSKAMLLRHFFINVQTADRYYSSIMAVAFGGSSAERAYLDAQAELASESEPPPMITLQ